MARGIHRAVKVRPFPFDFDVGFIDAVGVLGRPQVKANSFLQFRSIRLNPPINRRVIDLPSLVRDIRFCDTTVRRDSVIGGAIRGYALECKKICDPQTNRRRRGIFSYG
jgi:hypothetical protein